MTEIWEDRVVGFCRQETTWFCLTLVIGHTLMHRGEGKGGDLTYSGQGLVRGTLVGVTKAVFSGRRVNLPSGKGRTADHKSGNWLTCLCPAQGQENWGFC